MRELPEPKITPVLLDEFKQALAGCRGDLDAWLEVNDEAEVRAFVLAIQKQAYEDGLRDAGKDAKLIEWLAKNLEWDGHGYWLPEICIRERQLGEDFVPEPSANELRAMLTASQKEPQ